MNSGTQFIFIYQLLTIISTSFAIRRNTSLANARESYIMTYEQRREHGDPLCEANVTVKAAVCAEIFSNQSFQREYGIYLNKSAIFRLSLPNEDNYVIVNPDEETKLQQMFPCFGRHDPMQSGWGRDDHYKLIYISQGPHENSVFIYRRELTPDDELYHLQEVIDQIYFDRLNPIDITREETVIERESLQLITITTDTRRLEVNYIRNIIRGEYSLTTTFSICTLSKPEKLIVCRKVVEQIQKTQTFPFHLLDNMFKIMSMECSNTNIFFRHHEVNEQVQKETFTCYGYFKGIEHNLTRLKVSDGYYDHTILAFTSGIYDPDYYKIHASIHNTKGILSSSSSTSSSPSTSSSHFT